MRTETKKRGYFSGLFLGSIIGSVVMYFLDPQLGKRRRTQIRDQGMSKWNDARDMVNKKVKDLGNRAQGLKAKTEKAIDQLGSQAQETVQQAKSNIKQRTGGMKNQQPAEGQPFNTDI